MIEWTTSNILKRRIPAYQTLFHGWIYMNLLVMKRELQAKEEWYLFIKLLVKLN